MRFPTQPDDARTESNPERNRKHAPWVTPGPAGVPGIRLRLITLVGMLLLVGIAMIEAGKPENWAWMGFDRQPTIELDADPAPPETQPESNDASRETEFTDRAAPRSRVSTPAIRIAGPESRRPLPQSATSDHLDYPESAIRFWGEYFATLPDDGRESILELTRRLRRGIRALENEEQAARLTRWVDDADKARMQFHQAMFDQLTLMPDDAPDKPGLLEAYYAAEKVWDDQVLPALQASARGDDITLKQRQTIEQLQTVLDHQVMRQVNDRTALGWEGDSMAWLRLWERLDDEPLADASPATRLQLISQPNVYRGQPVQVQGWIRAARRESVAVESELSMDHYFELWLRPQDSPAGPYCVFVRSLPDTFPKIDNAFESLNQQVVLDGRFFKVRSYVAADRSVGYAPVILANELRPVVADSGPAVTGTSPGWYWWLGWLAVLPLLAAGIAWWVYRSSETRVFQPGKNAQSKINQSLGELRDDPEIKTDLERIRDLP